MKNRTLIALGLAAALGSTQAMAGLQIDPTGSGSVPASTFLQGLGSSFGNMLANNALAGAVFNTAAGGTMLYAQNAIPVLGGELTIMFSIPVTSGAGNALGNTTSGSILAMLQNAPGTFDMWYDDQITTGGVVADEATGLGYNDGAHLATGVVTVVPPLSFSNTTGTSTVLLDLNDPGSIPSIAGNGSADINVEFIQASINTLYVVNTITTLGIDLTSSDSLRLNYNVAKPSSAFGGGGIPVFVGSDGENDFDCGALQLCDIQFQMNSTLAFAGGENVPEPGPLALLAAGMGVLGFSARKKKRNS